MHISTRALLMGTLVLTLPALSSGTIHGQETGSIVGWGDMVIVEQAELDSLVAVTSGLYHGLAVRSDGTIVAWGSNDSGQCDLPSPNADFIDVASGYYHSLGLKSDGTIVALGNNDYGQCDVPSPNEDFIAVAGTGSFSMGLRGPSTTAVVSPRPGNMPGPFAIRSVSPNPFNPAAVISFETSVSSPLTMEIFDVRGRRVGKLGLGSFEPGVHHIWWDGRDDEGAELASGIYFLRLRGAKGESRAVKALLLR